MGLVLQLAGLISAPQVEVALYDRVQYQELRLGEILVLRGWLKVETADFLPNSGPFYSNKNENIQSDTISKKPLY
ncbi:MAG: hypothetical protein HC820_09080 [Hydrococcus sp. RM1_1_31]|nr:hypothetical protein [Hydrococcus sp. RM1_1_31]